MPGFRVTPHALARFRSRVLSPGGLPLTDAEVTRSITALVADPASVRPSASGRGTIVRTRGAFAFRAVLEPGSGDWTDVVTILEGSRTGGDRTAQRARRDARRAAAMAGGPAGSGAGSAEGDAPGTALLVTARLRNGFVASDPWSPSLDGLLAAAVMQERLGEDFALSALQPSAMRPVEGLPLERVAHGGLWWYACSSPLTPEGPRERRHFHRRFDEAEAVDRLPDVRRVADVAGPYKAYRLPETRMVVPEVRWHAVGDAAEVRRLLARIPAIGAGRSRGHGDVVEWIVTEDGEAAMARRHRPLPVAYAAVMAIEGPRMLAGIRPPARLPCNVVDCVVPPARGAAARAA